MSKNFLLTLSGTTPGPFDIYLDSVSMGNLLLSNVDSGSLLGGYMITTPDSSSYVILKNKANGCDNTYKVSIIDPSPSPTQTPSITSTPSLTPSITITPTLTATPTISVTRTPTVTPSITITPTVTPSITTSPSKTPTPTLTRTPSPSPQLVPTCVAMTGSFGSGLSSCYIDGQEQIQTNYSNTDFMILKDQYGNPINSPVTLTITASYSGGGYVFTIPSGSSTSDSYSYQGLSINYDCSENTITFDGIIETNPIYYPLC
jgi:hypothetical protein